MAINFAAYCIFLIQLTEVYQGLATNQNDKINVRLVQNLKHYFAGNNLNEAKKAKFLCWIR